MHAALHIRFIKGRVPTVRPVANVDYRNPRPVWRVIFSHTVRPSNVACMDCIVESGLTGYSS